MKLILLMVQIVGNWHPTDPLPPQTQSRIGSMSPTRDIMTMARNFDAELGKLDKLWQTKVVPYHQPGMRFPDDLQEAGSCIDAAYESLHRGSDWHLDFADRQIKRARILLGVDSPQVQNP